MARSIRPAIVVGLTLALLLGVAPVRGAAPDNDGPSGAIVVAAPSTVSVDLSEATLDGDPQYCGSGTASVWYRYTAAGDELLTVALAGDPWMGAIHVALDDPQSFHSCIFASWRTDLALAGGQTAYFQVSTDGSPTSFELSALSLIGNDRFDDAETIDSLPATVAPDLTHATSLDDPGTCLSGPGAWYRLALDDAQAVDITPGSDAVVAVVGSSPFDVRQCLYPWNGRQRVSLAGGADHLLVQSNTPSSGNTSVTIEMVPPPPANDGRSDAQVIPSLPAEVTVDLRSATPDDDSNQCFQSDWPSVWYRYTPTADEVIDVAATGGSGQAAAMVVYESDEGETYRCLTDAEPAALVRAGATVDIALGAPASAEAASMSITASPAPSIEVTISPTGTIERVGGVAVIDGTAVCSAAGDANVSVEGRQRVGRTILITGSGFTSFACSTTASPFQVRLPGEGGPFGTGSIAVTFDAGFGEWPIFDTDTGSATVKLRGK